ncbi:DNA excision repair protein ERCC-6-like (ATP-dependent helicase ERCC6-like) [Durusdinium trenchii]|uniref:DNA excision repair protein ERCC-6-like (ATP-dependent helicase ERCC6-like) n=1 Tax=Durusdinium trenchii TaxID=1381693 RepID=A0ABP0MVX0_9DINO
MAALVTCAFQANQLVQVLSKSSGAWVDATVHQVLQDGAVWVRYGNAQKVIPIELQSSTLRSKSAPLPAHGERVQVYSKSQRQWITGRVREIWPDGSVHVQYEDAKHLYKVIAPELQDSLLRPLEVKVDAQEPAQAPTKPPQVDEERAEQRRLAELADESERLKATIARQQEQINALLQKEVGASDVPAASHAASEVPAASHAENWSCKDCTFQNVEPLQECEMCGAPRVSTVPEAPPAKRVRRAPPVIDVPVEPPAVEPGAAEFLRRATEVVEASQGSQPCSRNAAELVEIPLEGEEAATSSEAGGQSLARLPRSFHEKLCPYQRAGVAWMWRLKQRRSGGILADEMGLGKTVQACGMIQALQSPSSRSSHILVIMPVTLLDQWAKELARWCPTVRVYIYHGSSGHRNRALRAVMRGGVLLTSYAILKNEEEKLACVNASEAMQGTWLKKKEDLPRDKPWDLVICDEAHVMRTISTLLGKAMRKISSSCRILLTGTPVQNALQDLWALMDFAEPGLLGNHATFTKRFNDPIEKGSLRDASPSAVALKKHLCEQLWTLAKPHLLRRTKEHLQAESSEAILGKPLSPRMEFVVWLTPSRDQVRTYQKALETSDIIHEANCKSKLGVEVFRAIALLKRLCNHPVLAIKPEAWKELLASAGCSPEAPAAIAAEEDKEEEEAADPGKAVERMLKNLKRDAISLVGQSAKLQCLSSLLPSLASKGHRTLIFSQGVRMMDLVELCVLKRLQLSYLRIDGSTDVNARNTAVQKFQETKDYSCMLLTTKVGGYGLNLTSADRVIILDPAWNPAVDMQAVDRAHRIGQEKEVKTYRLVMSGLIEDKMFRLQVFKMGLTKTALETKQQQRYFTAEEIHGLFEWTDPKLGETRKLLRDMHGIEDCAAVSDPGLTNVAGLSSFSYLYQTLQGEEEIGEEMAPEVRLMKAQLKVAEEAAGKAAQTRLEVETSLQKAQQELQKTQDERDLTGARKAANGQVKRAQAAVVQWKRNEAMIMADVEKATKARDASLKEVTAADEQQKQLSEEAAIATASAAEASQGLAAAESRVAKLVEALQIVLANTAKNAFKVPARLAEALQAHGEAKRSMDDEWEKLLEIESRYEECFGPSLRCQAEMNIVMQGLGHSGSVPLKTSQAARRSAEKEKAQAEKSLAKATVLSSKAVEQLNQAMAELKKLLDNSGGEATRDQDQELQEAWAQLLQHREDAAKAQAAERRLRRSRLAAGRKVKEQQARHAAVEKDLAKASKEMQAWQAELAELEQQLSEAQQQCLEVEEAERTRKRKRDEWRASISEAKESLKSARLAEKTAAAERTALYKHYAQADEALKDALKDARSAERAAAQERQKAIAAIQALKAEAYDANQVVEAYEAKKRVRPSEAVD